MSKIKPEGKNQEIFLTASILARLGKLGLKIVESSTGKVSSDKELISPVYITWEKSLAAAAKTAAKIKMRLLAAGNPDKFIIKELSWEKETDWPNTKLKKFHDGIAWLANPRSIKHIPSDLGDLWKEIALVINELDYLGVPEFESGEFIVEKS